MKIFPSTTVIINSGGATTFNQYTTAFEKAGPSSYTTGGLDLDLTNTFSSINSASVYIKKGTRGSLGIGCIEIREDVPSSGHLTIKFLKDQYTKATSFGNVSGQPSGVTVQATSGQAGTSESSHTHAIDHDHPSFASGTPAASGAGVLSQTLGVAHNTHTHTLDLPAFTGTSGAGTSHNHTDNSLYAHSHSLTHTDTSFTLTEIANATNLSATTLIVRVTGVRA